MKDWTNYHEGRTVLNPPRGMVRSRLSLVAPLPRSANEARKAAREDASKRPPLRVVPKPPEAPQGAVTPRKGHPWVGATVTDRDGAERFVSAMASQDTRDPLWWLRRFPEHLVVLERGPKWGSHRDKDLPTEWARWDNRQPTPAVRFHTPHGEFEAVLRPDGSYGVREGLHGELADALAPAALSVVAGGE